MSITRGTWKPLLTPLKLCHVSIAVVWPLHPRTRNVLRHTNRLQGCRQQCISSDPVGYLEMVQLEKHAAVIATDSGGVQKEAFFYRVPCVTLRHELNGSN